MSGHARAQPAADRVCIYIYSMYIQTYIYSMYMYIHICTLVMTIYDHTGIQPSVRTLSTNFGANDIDVNVNVNVGHRSIKISVPSSA